MRDHVVEGLDHVHRLLGIYHRSLNSLRAAEGRVSRLRRDGEPTGMAASVVAMNAELLAHMRPMIELVLAQLRQVAGMLLWE